MRGLPVALSAVLLLPVLSHAAPGDPASVTRPTDDGPADHLPPHITRLTHFGERADFSHDGKRVLFVEKTYGDVYEIEIATRAIRPMTHHYFHYGYTRALYLSDGDILLSGCKTFDPQNPHFSRNHAELFVLNKDLKTPPTPLGEMCSEG